MYVHCALCFHHLSSKNPVNFVESYEAEIPQTVLLLD